MLIADEILDGYRLVRLIGAGGFGEVWLCQMQATGEWKALKFLPVSASRHLEQELEALIRYRSVMSKLQCAHLLPIEHVNRDEHRGLFYTMPLADGLRNGDPCDPAWQPKSLAALIADRRSAPAWFSAEEVLQIMLPVLAAAQRLSDAGVVHRDIKPENLLFVGGQWVLGDISLLGADGSTLSGRGTPGYAPPSWYLESQGNPDMWGVATTFYSLLSGNAPDKVGRGAFLWPPQGEEAVDGALWRQWHQVVWRATQENPAERFLRFDAMAVALRKGSGFDFKESPPLKQNGRRNAALLMLVLLIGATGWEVFRFWNPKKPMQEPARPIATPAVLSSHATPPSLPRSTSPFDRKYAEAEAKIAAARDAFVAREQKRVVDHYLNAHSQEMLELLRQLQKQCDDYFAKRQHGENPAGDEIKKTCEAIKTILPDFTDAHTHYVRAKWFEVDVGGIVDTRNLLQELRDSVENERDSRRFDALAMGHDLRVVWPAGLNSTVENRDAEIEQILGKLRRLQRELGASKEDLCVTLQIVTGEKMEPAKK